MHAPLSELLQAIKSVEPLPEVVMRVIALARQPDVVPRELVEVVQTDGGMTAKVLKLANSSLYGFRRRIASLEDAGNLLGVRTLENLVLTSCTGRYFRDYGRARPEELRSLWAESISNALAANLIAQWNPSVETGQAYTAGLLQNIGRSVTERFLPRESALVAVAVQRGSTLVDAEQEVLGLDHAEIGARLAERWCFPDVLIDTIRWHHHPERATASPELAYVAYVAEELTRAIAEQGKSDAPIHRLDPDAARRTRIDPEDLAPLSAILTREIERAQEFVEL